jgi:hypothetical protein
MTRHLFLAISFSIIAVLSGSLPAAASTQRCEDRHVNCLGRCADWTGGAGDYFGRQNKCLLICDRRLTQCLVRDSMRRGWR